jgi:molybdopterin molybdotransferase
MPQAAELMSVEAALQLMLAAARPRAAAQSVPLLHACGRVLAAELRSPLDLPPLANSAMDGYALRCADVPAPGTRLPVAQRIAAGQVGAPLRPGTAARIFTGAQLPEGADAVLPQEVCTADADAVTFLEAPKPGACIRARGSEIAAGSLLLPAGQRLRAPDIGLAAAVGIAALQVAPRPRVALLSTGDELTAPGQPLRPGAIYNSNRYLLGALLQELGCEVSDLGQIPDRLDATRDALRAAAFEHDLILSSGGVSVGGEDHVRPALQELGRLALWQIAIKPGKPLAFGAVRAEDGPGSCQEAHFIGLPGNPVSALITFLVFVRPFLLALQGAARLHPRPMLLPSASDWPRGDRRREFLRARLDAAGHVELFAQQGSAALTSVAWGDGLVDNPPGRSFAKGDLVAFLPYSSLLG